MPRKFPRLLWLAAPMAYALFFFRLGGAGLLGPDEPRYAAIGRAMARSGDWVTPRLWGQPWFEKPALLYWMTGAGFRFGLGPDLAPRLPVAMVSVGFLIFFYWFLNREFGRTAARLATLMLGTSAAWIGFSQVGVTDLPMAAFFSAAMLLALPWIAKRDARYLPAAAAALGLAVLAKGLLPLALAAPVALRLRWFRDLVRPRAVLPFAAVALPWYIACYLRNGAPFLRQFFLVHHLQRFTSSGLLHVQPWWFYLPLLPALLLPWAPLLPAAAPRKAWRDPRRRFLLIWVIFGVVFLSASTNKVPGYLLPLLPPLAILMALGVEEPAESPAGGPAPRATRILVASCALLLVAYPVAAPALPAAVANIWAAAPRPAFHWTWLLPAVPAAAAWLLDRRGRRLAAVAAIGVSAAAAVVWLKVSSEPEVARLASSRALSREIIRHPGEVCLQDVRRAWEYGLNYYTGSALPPCGTDPKPFRVLQPHGRPPELAGAGGTTNVPDLVQRQ